MIITFPNKIILAIFLNLLSTVSFERVNLLEARQEMGLFLFKDLDGPYHWFISTLSKQNRALFSRKIKTQYD